MGPDTLRGGVDEGVRRLYPYTATSDERTSPAHEEDGRNRDVSWIFVTSPAPSAVSATATTCQGRGRDGRSLQFRAPASGAPNPQLRGPRGRSPAGRRPSPGRRSRTTGSRGAGSS